MGPGAYLEDAIQGDTSQFDGHPPWEVELWPDASGFSL